MTDAQIFQMIGIVYAAVGIGLIISTGYYMKLVDSFVDNPAVTYLGALMAFAIGFLLVSFHNVWVADWPVIITIIGYLVLIKGITLLVFPRALMSMAKAIMGKPKNIRLYAAIVLIIGLGLMYLGFK